MSTDALARVVRRLTAEANARFEALGREVRPGRVVITTDLLGLAEALALPGVGPSVAEALVVAEASAHGIETGRVCECAFCRRPWTATRAPVAVFVAARSQPASTTIGLVCAACDRAKPSRLRRLIRETVRRDLLPDAEAVHLAPGGRA